MTACHSGSGLRNFGETLVGQFVEAEELSVLIQEKLEEVGTRA